MVIVEDLEEFKDSLLVEFIFVGSYHDRTIIYIILEVSKILIMQGSKDMIHEALHASWGIGQSKRHYFWGVKSLCCFKGKYIF